MNTYEVFENLLNRIENIIFQKITIEQLAKDVFVSPVHLQRIFKVAFDIPLAEYVRLRKLQKSLELLYITDKRVDEIAYMMGFEHESSYIRSFKREYQFSPGEIRKNHHIIKVVPPMSMSKFSDLDEGVLSAVEYVMIPEYTLIGREHKIPSAKSAIEAPRAAFDFWLNDRHKICEISEDNVYYGLTKLDSHKEEYTYYYTSVAVEKDMDVPAEFIKNTIGGILCARFRYIGRHHYFELSSKAANSMYRKIDEFTDTPHANIDIPMDYFFERIAEEDYDGTYCVMEWFTPVKSKKI